MSSMIEVTNETYILRWPRYSDHKVTFTDSQVTYTEPKMTYSEPKVTYSEPISNQ